MLWPQMCLLVAGHGWNWPISCQIYSAFVAMSKTVNCPQLSVNISSDANAETRTRAAVTGFASNSSPLHPAVIVR